MVEVVQDQVVATSSEIPQAVDVKKIRKTGIPIIGNVPWGTHFCLFYQKKDDLIDVLVPFFKAGLESNEFCMWVTSEPLGREEAENAMRKAVPNFDRFLKKGQIEIVPHTEWYLKDGAFDLQLVLNAWIEKLDEALAKGYDGIRVTGNTAWLEKKDWKDFADCEEEVDAVIGKNLMIAVCTYSIDRCSASEVVDVVRNHQFALVRRGGEWEIFESSELRRAREALRQSQQKFERLFMGNPEASVYLDAEFHIVDANPRFLKLFGYSIDEVRGKHIDDVVVPENMMEEGKTLNENAANGYVYHDTERRREDGSLVPVSISAAPLVVKDKLIGYVGVYKDISEMKKTEEELAESRRHFQTLFDLMVDPVIIVDEKGKFLEVTSRVEEITGFKKEELVGKNFFRTKIATAKTKAIMIKNLAKRMMGMHVSPYEVEILTKDGRKLPYEINAAKIEYKGKPAGLVVFRDMAERKKLEEKLRIVGSLTRHDVRNKLTAVAGNAYLLRKRLADDPDATECLNGVEAAVRESERIFDFASAYEKLGVEQLAYVDAKKILDEAVTLFPDLKGVKIVNDCGGLTLLADSLLRQLFYNLIDNSLKYGQKITMVRAHYEKAYPDQDQLKVFYEDDGMGIPAANKPQIFKEGYSTGGSTGYGLYLIKKMIEVYGWTIQETGEPGKGAQFTIEMPKVNQNGKENYRIA
jgi:PAS domain S-box-containing protein